VTKKRRSEGSTEERKPVRKVKYVEKHDIKLGIGLKEDGMKQSNKAKELT
jgi:hypothetical protein